MATIKFSDAIMGYTSDRMAGKIIYKPYAMSAEEIQAAHEEHQPMNTIDPVIKSGPHMFDEECHCDHCVGVREKRDAGMHIDIENVKCDALLCMEAAQDEWLRAGLGAGVLDKPDPIMSIPCSVVLALCEESKKGHWEGKFDMVAKENDSLRDELKSLKEKPRPLAPIRSMNGGPMKFSDGASGPHNPVEIEINLSGNVKPLVAALSYVDKCPACGTLLAVSVGDPLPPHCPHCAGG